MKGTTMGYTIIIGEAVIERDDDPDFEPYQRIWVEGCEHPDAPDHCPFTKKGNSRSPSYTGWSTFCTEAGITQLFYGQGWSRIHHKYKPCPDGFHRETPLLRGHPGAQPINQNDADYVSAKLKAYQTSHPDAVPGFWDFDRDTGRDIDTGKDPTLARLLWLDFWMRWAVENCERPTVANS